MQLILASSSPYRAALLQALRLPFTAASPDIDESPLPGEDARVLSARLALNKAQALAAAYPQALIIGSDQVALCRGELLGKPGNFERAREQLLFCSGHWVEFHTALVLLDTASGQQRSCVDIYRVKFRALPLAEIEYYLHRDEPFDCAGSFKAEGLGIALFEEMAGSDFHSLLGLPMISLCRLLRESGLNPLLPDAPARP